MKRHSLWQRAATKYRSISIWQSDFMMHVQLQIEKDAGEKKARRWRWWWRKINKTTYDRIPTFEHDKTHPFDCTMATTTIVSPLLACIFFLLLLLLLFILVSFFDDVSFFSFRVIFCIFNSTEWNKKSRLSILNCVCLAQTFLRCRCCSQVLNWRVEIFPWKKARRE